MSAKETKKAAAPDKETAEQAAIPMITIDIMGKKYEVPEGLTMMKAMEYAGYKLTRGCGCRGRVCGACATIYRKIDETKWRIGLACQTVAEPDTTMVQVVYTPAYRAMYDVNAVELTDENILEAYPTLKRCMGCNTCTRSCPMDLSVLDYVSAILRGDFETALHLSMECIMCGMCASRCPAELSPMNMAMMVRRLYGKKRAITPPSVAKRLKDVRSGAFDEDIKKYQGMTKEELQVVYKGFQATKGASV